MTCCTLPKAQRVATAVLLLGLVGVACTDDGPTTAPEPGGDLPTELPHYPEMETYPSAIMQGMLVGDGSCLLLNGKLAVWPPGATLVASGTEAQVVSRDGELLAVVGDELRMGGGEIPWDLPPTSGEDWREHCATRAPMWAMLYPLSEGDPDE